MELFTVNRYVDNEFGNTETNEDEILQKLMNKVEKRKRKQIESKKIEPETQTNENKLKKDQPLELIEEDNEEIDPINEGIPATNTFDDVDNDVLEAGSGFEVLGEDADVRKKT